MALTKTQIIVIVAVVMAAAAYWAVDRFVVTEKKRVGEAVEQLRDSVARGDLRAFAACISTSYSDDSFSADKLLSLAAKFFETRGATDVTLHDKRIAVNGTAASVRGSVTIRTQNGYWGRSEWQVDFQKESDGVWRVIRLTPLRFGGKDVTGWGDAVRGAGL